MHRILPASIFPRLTPTFFSTAPNSTGEMDRTRSLTYRARRALCSYRHHPIRHNSERLLSSNPSQIATSTTASLQPLICLIPPTPLNLSQSWYILQAILPKRSCTTFVPTNWRHSPLRLLEIKSSCCLRRFSDEGDPWLDSTRGLHASQPFESWRTPDIWFYTCKLQDARTNPGGIRKSSFLAQGFCYDQILLTHAPTVTRASQGPSLSTTPSSDTLNVKRCDVYEAFAEAKNEFRRKVFIRLNTVPEYLTSSSWLSTPFTGCPNCLFTVFLLTAQTTRKNFTCSPLLVIHVSCRMTNI